MDSNQLRVVGVALFFLFIFLSGFRLSRAGKPYNAIPFNIHKLVSLAMVVFLAITVSRTSQTASLGAMELAVIALILFVITIISGGLISTDKPMPAAIRTLHHITPYPTALLTALTLYLVLS